MIKVLTISLITLLIPAAMADITIKDDSYRTIGHIDSDGTVKDDSYRTIGHIDNDGTVKDDSYRTIGHIDKDGTVKDDSYRTIAHFDNAIGKDWMRVGGYLFFFMRRF